MDPGAHSDFLAAAVLEHGRCVGSDDDILQRERTAAACGDQSFELDLVPIFVAIIIVVVLPSNFTSVARTVKSACVEPLTSTMAPVTTFAQVPLENCVAVSVLIVVPLTTNDAQVPLATDLRSQSCSLCPCATRSGAAPCCRDLTVMRSSSPPVTPGTVRSASVPAPVNRSWMSPEEHWSTRTCRLD